MNAIFEIILNYMLVAISNRPIVDYSSITGEPMRTRVSEIHRKLLGNVASVGYQSIIEAYEFLKRNRGLQK